MSVPVVTSLDPYLAPHIRHLIEERYYVRINQQARLENSPDPNLFLQPPYPALWADHGVVHVRNVAENILRVLDVANGVMLPRRAPKRLEFMKAYGVMLTYAHDIGMIDFSHFGRVVHPEYTTQAVMSAQFDDIIDAIWNQGGPVVARLRALDRAGLLRPKPAVVLRELVSMANAHSKSKVPIAWLNSADQLRQAMQRTLCTTLQALYQEQELAKARQAFLATPKLELAKPEIHDLSRALHNVETDADPAVGLHPLAEVRGRYENFERDSYHWLVARDQTRRALAEDVIDTLRALRCADALRQRGTVLKTSGQYEIFVDQHTANAIYALRLEDGRLLLFQVPDYVGAGEANIASSELEREGNLRISFHRGSFGNRDALERAVYSAALIVNDLQSDVIESFVRPRADTRASKRAQDMEIFLEEVGDNLDFADQVIEQLKRINPPAAAKTQTVPSLKNVPDAERHRYLEAVTPLWSSAERSRIVQQIAKAGHKAEGIDVRKAFEHVKFVQIAQGTILIEPDTPARFVYIPMETGLEILPLGGYEPIAAKPWIPIGVTGVIRGAARNARVIARSPVSLLMIPADTYMKHWHRTYSTSELAALLTHRAKPEGQS